MWLDGAVERLSTCRYAPGSDGPGPLLVEYTVREEQRNCRQQDPVRASAESALTRDVGSCFVLCRSANVGPSDRHRPRRHDGVVEPPPGSAGPSAVCLPAASRQDMLFYRWDRVRRQSNAMQPQRRRQRVLCHQQGQARRLPHLRAMLCAGTRLRGHDLLKRMHRPDRAGRRMPALLSRS